MIRAMFTGGNTTRMADLAETEQNPDLRREAIRHLGLKGSEGSSVTVVEIYGSDRDPAVKRAVVQALSLQSNATALVALARKEADVALKKDIVQSSRRWATTPQPATT